MAGLVTFAWKMKAGEPQIQSQTHLCWSPASKTQGLEVSQIEPKLISTKEKFLKKDKACLCASGRLGSSHWQIVGLEAGILSFLPPNSQIKELLHSTTV